MNRKQNNAYMLRQWIVPGIAGLLAALFLGYQLLQGNVLPVAVVVAIVAALAAGNVLGGARQVAQLLQAAAPEPLLAHYDRSLGQAPMADRDAALAFSKALVYTVYGRFSEAQSALAPIEWAARPPMVAAQRTLLQAWWAYLSPAEGADGLALARQARQLADVAGALPGAGLSLSVYDAAVELGQLLNGNGGAEAAARLEGRLRRQPILPRALLASGLLIHYQRAGPPDAAERLRQQLAKIAPHGAGLAPSG